MCIYQNKKMTDKNKMAINQSKTLYKIWYLLLSQPSEIFHMSDSLLERKETINNRMFPSRICFFTKHHRNYLPPPSTRTRIAENTEVPRKQISSQYKKVSVFKWTELQQNGLLDTDRFDYFFFFEGCYSSVFSWKTELLLFLS